MTEEQRDRLLRELADEHHRQISDIEDSYRMAVRNVWAWWHKRKDEA